MVHINKCLVKLVSNLTGNFINILVIRLPKCGLVKLNAKSSVFFDGENVNEKIITSYFQNVLVSKQIPVT